MKWKKYIVSFFTVLILSLPVSGWADSVESDTQLHQTEIGNTLGNAIADQVIDVLNNATAVSVAAGATLAAEGDVTIPGLAADLSTGCGTISNFTFAASGTVCLENMPAGLQTVSLDWTLLDCDGVANVSNWKVAVDGEETDRWRMQVSQAGKISVCRLGFRMIVR